MKLFKPKKKDENYDKRIESELQELGKKREGFHIKSKEVKKEHYSNIVIESRILKIDSAKSKNLPKSINFLLILTIDYPLRSPLILSKTNFCSPSLMDGRDLLCEIYPNWNMNTQLITVVEAIPDFLKRVINNVKGYKFYGQFHLGSVYNMKNFEKMIVNEFNVRIEDDGQLKIPKSLDVNVDYSLVLSDDALILFKKLDSGNGEIVFWSTLYGITDVRMNKRQKIVSINFIENQNSNDFHLKLSVENILFFRDTLVKKMKSLKIKPETTKLIKGKNQEKILTEKEINSMNIQDVEQSIEQFNKKIEKGEISDYTVNTLNALCGKAIEHYSLINVDKVKKYLELLKKIFETEGVQKLTDEDQNIK